MLLANKGYSSTSAMHEAALRIKEKMDEGKICHVLYLGDHDPSGVDMGRDIKKRLAEFECEVEIERIALTMEQIRKYNLPSDTVKTTDSRSTKYIQKYGNRYWELDALNPEILTDLLASSILAYLDEDKYSKKKDQEKDEKAYLNDVAKWLDVDEQIFYDEKGRVEEFIHEFELRVIDKLREDFGNGSEEGKGDVLKTQKVGQRPRKWGKAPERLDLEKGKTQKGGL